MIAWLAAGLTLLIGRGASLGAGEEVAPGTRVRLTQADQVLIGVLQEVTGDALVVKTTDKQSLRVARTELVKLEVTQAPSRKGTGALIGAAVGAGAALLIAAATSSEDDIVLDSVGELALALCVLTVPAGAAVGAIAAPGEQWRAVSMDTIHSDTRKGSWRVGLAFTIRF